MHHFVGADSSCISWGQGKSGELGYGPHGQKYLAALEICTFNSMIVPQICLNLELYVQVYSRCLICFYRSSAAPKKVDMLEGMHVLRLVLFDKCCFP